MPIPAQTKRMILDALTRIGKPATITQIEQNVNLERHTLSKYLSVLHREGVLAYESIGRAKLWRLNDAPLRSIFESVPESLGFAEQMLITILNKVPSGIVVIDSECRIEFLNEIMREMYGDVRNHFLYRVLLGQSDPLRLGSIRAVISGEASYAEQRLQDLAGNILEVRAVPVRKPDNGLLTILIVEDITQDLNVERALRRGEQLYRSLIEASPDGIYLLDLEANVLYTSKTLQEALGYRESEIKGRPAFDFVAAQDHDKVRDHMSRLIAGESVGTRKYTLLRNDGKRVITEVNATIARDEKKKPMGFIGYVRNLTT